MPIMWRVCSSGIFIGPGAGGTKVAGMVTNSIFTNNPFYGLADYATGVPLLERHWYLLAASFDATSRAIETRKLPCTWSAPFGRPVEPDV